MGKVFLAAVTADEAGTVIADGQLGYQNLYLLALAKGLLAEEEHIGKLLSCLVRLFFQ